MVRAPLLSILQGKGLHDCRHETEWDERRTQNRRRQIGPPVVMAVSACALAGVRMGEGGPLRRRRRMSSVRTPWRRRPFERPRCSSRPTLTCFLNAANPGGLAGGPGTRQSCWAKPCFWDTQVGSDGRVACATCHFARRCRPPGEEHHAPGHQGQEVRPGRPELHTHRGPSFPFHQRLNPELQKSRVTRNFSDTVGSQGRPPHPVRRYRPRPGRGGRHTAARPSIQGVWPEHPAGDRATGRLGPSMPPSISACSGTGGPTTYSTA